MRTVEALGLSLPSKYAAGSPTYSVVAVVGCGGKTSLIERIAGDIADRRVLVSPTTKMFPLNLPGADCRGILNPATGKLEALPPIELAELAPQYDIALLEADGSRGLPCKGWREDEPVVPVYATHTVGIVTLNALGKAATGDTVHNLAQFLELTGLREGQAITAKALRDMVCARGGMFKNSLGNRILLVNQVEDEATADAAREFLRAIKAGNPGCFSKLLFGSVYRDKWWEV